MSVRMSAPPVLARSGFTPSQINHDVVLGLRAADQQVAVRRCADRVRAVIDLARHKAALASVADTGTTRPPHGHVARLGQFEQAMEGWIPPHIEAAARKRN